MSTVPSILNLILCLFTIPDDCDDQNDDDQNAGDVAVNTSNDKLCLDNEGVDKHKIQIQIQTHQSQQ